VVSLGLKVSMICATTWTSGFSRPHERLMMFVTCGGLLYMSAFTQAISDAAHSIVDVLLRDIEIPPLFK